MIKNREYQSKKRHKKKAVQCLLEEGSQLQLKTLK